VSARSSKANSQAHQGQEPPAPHHTIWLDFPPTWRERPPDGPGKSYSPADGKGGIIRVSLHPPYEESLRDEQELRRAFDAIVSGVKPGTGELVREFVIQAPFGPGVLRIGRHPRYGIVAVAVLFGEVTLAATYEMGDLHSAAREVVSFKNVLCSARVE
jgi:hypothetical protein